MPKILTQLVTSTISSITASTGAASGGGGGISYDVSVLATGQSSTSSYNGLSYSNVSTVQHGTFTNGTAVVSSSNNEYSASSNGTCQFVFDTAGIYVIEFNSYASSSGGGFQFIDLTRNGSSGVDEQVSFLGIYSNYNRKSTSSIRKFEVGDKLTFFTASSIPSANLSRILIAKIG
tara:strand:+ start:5453 stop:5980 length:528 start_codon:yes stop_codon:yes gene_type:complete